MDKVCTCADVWQHRSVALDKRRRAQTVAVALGVAMSAGGCQYGYMAHRGLHYVRSSPDAEPVLVETPPPSPAAYEAYLRARVALERGDFETADRHIIEALTWQPTEPYLWTVKAEIALAAGDRLDAERSLAIALELAPGYAAATELLDSM